MLLSAIVLCLLVRGQASLLPASTYPLSSSRPLSWSSSSVSYPGSPLRVASSADHHGARVGGHQGHQGGGHARQGLRPLVLNPAAATLGYQFHVRHPGGHSYQASYTTPADQWRPGRHALQQPRLRSQHSQGVQPSVRYQQPEQRVGRRPQYTDYYIAPQATPAQEYLPPSQEPVTPPSGDYLPPSNEPVKPPTGDYLPPSKDPVVPPTGDYLPPSKDPVVPPTGDYLPPSKDPVVPPTGEYLPPSQDPITPPKAEYLPPAEPVSPPADEYLPPLTADPVSPPVQEYLPPDKEVPLPPLDAGYLPPSADPTVPPPAAEYLPPVQSGTSQKKTAGGSHSPQSAGQQFHRNPGAGLIHLSKNVLKQSSRPHQSSAVSRPHPTPAVTLSTAGDPCQSRSCDLHLRCQEVRVPNCQGHRCAGWLRTADCVTRNHPTCHRCDEDEVCVLRKLCALSESCAGAMQCMRRS